MAWTNWGFDGTINEAQWSQMAGLLGNGYVAAGNGDCLVTAVGGARSVSVAAGTLYGDGIVSVNDAAETVAMTTPVNGQWYLICLKREWATNTATLRAVAGATTTTTTPTVAPTSFPTINTSPGVLTDQPIAWAWCNSANTTVVVFDLRLLPMRTQPVSVADSAKRDAKFPAPVQGNQVWRDDLGNLQTYFAAYNSSSNPGGRAAGWYNDKKIVSYQEVFAASQVSNSTTTMVSTGLSLTITPKNPANKLIIQVNLNGVYREQYSAQGGADISLQRDGVHIYDVFNVGYTATGILIIGLAVPIGIIADAGSTNPTTFEVKIASRVGGNGAGCQQAGSRSNMTILEVEA